MFVYPGRHRTQLSPHRCSPETSLLYISVHTPEACFWLDYGSFMIKSWCQASKCAHILLACQQCLGYSCSFNVRGSFRTHRPTSPEILFLGFDWSDIGSVCGQQQQAHNLVSSSHGKSSFTIFKSFFKMRR